MFHADFLKGLSLRGGHFFGEEVLQHGKHHRRGHVFVVLLAHAGVAEVQFQVGREEVVQKQLPVGIPARAVTGAREFGDEVEGRDRSFTGQLSVVKSEDGHDPEGQLMEGDHTGEGDGSGAPGAAKSCRVEHRFQIVAYNRERYSFTETERFSQLTEVQQGFVQ